MPLLERQYHREGEEDKVQDIQTAHLMLTLLGSMPDHAVNEGAREEEGAREG